MALVVQQGRAQPLSQSLQDAIRDFRVSLTVDQQRKLDSATIPTPESVFRLTIEIDNENASRRSRCVGTRLSPVLQSVQQFSAIVETFVSSNPQIAALVWGSVKFALLFATNFSSFFDKLSTVLMDLRNTCPRFARYQELYADSEGLQRALCNYFATLVRFCQQVVQVTQRSALKQIRNALWQSFDSEFGAFTANLERESRNVDGEITLASRENAQRAQRLLEYESKESRSFRHLVMRGVGQSEDWHVEAVQRRSVSKRVELLDKLSTYDYMLSYRQACKKRHWSTNAWPIDTPAYQAWMESEDSLCWCSGALGSGKTIVTSSVINDLLQKPDLRVLFYFCQFDAATSLTASTILRCLLRQCLTVESFTPSLERRLRAALQGTVPDLEDIQKLLTEQVLGFTKPVLVLDALDECKLSERQTVLRSLQKLLATTKARIFLASRPHLEDAIQAFTPTLHRLNTKTEAMDTNVELYVSNELEELRKEEQLVVGDPSLLPEIRNTICLKASGMFLLVYFMILEICEQSCDADIKRALASLPQDLFGYYDLILRKIEASGKAKIVIKTFQIVTAAQEPLALEQLREALSVEWGQTFLQKDRLINDIRKLTLWCGDMIAIDEEGLLVHLAHPTIREFLLSRDRQTFTHFHFDFEEADMMLGKICTAYLNFSDFETQLAKIESRPAVNPAQLLEGILKKTSPGAAKFSSLLGRPIIRPQPLALSLERHDTSITFEDYHFRSYSQRYWLHHTSWMTDTSESWSSWKRLFESPHRAGLPWTSASWSSETVSEVHAWLDRTARTFDLHTVPGNETLSWVIDNSHLGLLSLLFLKPHVGHANNSQDKATFNNMRVQALCVFSVFGNLKLFKYFHEMTAISLNAPTQRNDTFLHIAIRESHYVLAKYLLDKDYIRVDIQDGDGQTAIHVAAVSTDPEIFNKVLHRGSPGLVQTNDHKLRTVLHYAAIGGDIEILRTIQSKPGLSDLFTRKDSDKKTPLMLAARCGNVQTFRLLLDAQYGFQFSDGHTRFANLTVQHPTLLHEATSSGCCALVEELLKKAPFASWISSLDGRGNNVLHLAAERGFGDILNLYSDRPGFEGLVAHTNKEGYRPFDLAVLHGYRDCCMLLRGRLEPLPIARFLSLVRKSGYTRHVTHSDDTWKQWTAGQSCVGEPTTFTRETPFEMTWKMIGPAYTAYSKVAERLDCACFYTSTTHMREIEPLMAGNVRSQARPYIGVYYAILNKRVEGDFEEFVEIIERTPWWEEFSSEYPGFSFVYQGDWLSDSKKRLGYDGT